MIRMGTAKIKKITGPRTCEVSHDLLFLVVRVLQLKQQEYDNKVVVGCYILLIS